MSVRKKDLPFKEVNDLALGQYPPLLFNWFPNGMLVDGNKEFAVGDLSGSPGGKDGGSLKVNLKTGEWAEMNGGEPSGGDPVSLYAHAFCGGDMGRACHELGAMLGVPGCEPPNGAKVVQFPVKNPPRAAEKVDWRPMVPPPDGVAEPIAELKKWQHVYRYRDRAGTLLRYVVRRDARGEKPKVVLPLTYGYLKDKKHPDGSTGWHYKVPASPRKPYGLERLDGRPVILQEGEKKTDQVQRLMPGYACLSLTGGTGGKNHNDLMDFAGYPAPILIPADNDSTGRETVSQTAETLRALACEVFLIDPTGYPEGWDLGNAVDDGWTSDRLTEHLEARKRDKFDEPNPGDVDVFDLEQPPDDDSEWQEEGGTPQAEVEEGIIPLGQDDNSLFWYYSKAGGRVTCMSAAQHTEMQLLGLASLTWWRGFGQFRKGDCEVNWRDAGAFFMDAGRRLPPYDPDKLRGVGAWIDGKRCVLHLGERLIVDGEPHRSLRLPGSRFIYERRLSINQTIAPPICSEDAKKLLIICKSLPWEKPKLFCTLMAGWIAVAPICGGLKWRPAIWVTGGSGAGKTTIDTNIVAPILEGVSLRLQSNSTEAGIRQTLKNNAISVIFDEAETEGMSDKERFQHVLELVRASTSEGGAAIVKGTQSQVGAKRFVIRSCFMFMSVNVNLTHAADENRITVLSLRTLPKSDPAAFEASLQRIAETITPEYCAGFVARSVKLMPVIRDNAATFAKAVAAKLGSARIGDQIGTLLAGAYSLTCEDRITLEDARVWVEKQDWTDATAADAETDEQQLVNRLLLRRINVRSGVDRTVGELLRAAAGRDEEVSATKAEDLLKQHGLMFRDRNIGKSEPYGMWVANRHTELENYLKDTPWATSWGRALKRYPGAQSSVSSLYFAGVYQRATFVPVVLPDG